MADKTLNVILHGNIALHITKTRIKGMIPDFGAVHCYRAGSWLGETTLRSGQEYVLSGVKGGSAKFDLQANLFLDKAKEDPATPRYATLIFPRPAAIVSTRRFKFQLDGGLGGDISELAVDSTISSPPTEATLSTVQIFTYTFPNADDIRLGQHVWDQAAYNDVLNLHIFAEPDSQGAHGTVDDFAGSLNLFRKSDGSKFELYPFGFVQDQTAVTLPADVIPEEIETLADRVPHLLGIGKDVRSGATPVWNRTFGIDGLTQPVCGAPSGGDRGDF